MPSQSATWIGIGLAVWAGSVAIFALLRRVEGRHALTLRLCTSVLGTSGDVLELHRQVQRSPLWWQDADQRDRAAVDRALTTWDVAASYVRTGLADKRTVLDVFRSQLVDLWERAHPYVQHRRVEQPLLWASLADLYFDAYESGGRPEAASAPTAPTPRPRVGLGTSVGEGDWPEEPVLVAASLQMPVADPTPVPRPTRVAEMAPPALGQAAPSAPDDPWHTALLDAIRPSATRAADMTASTSAHTRPQSKEQRASPRHTAVAAAAAAPPLAAAAAAEPTGRLVTAAGPEIATHTAQPLLIDLVNVDVQLPTS